MRVPKGLTVKMEYEEQKGIYFTVETTKFYIFKTIMRIAMQQAQRPLTMFLVCAIAVYYLVK